MISFENLKQFINAIMAKRKKPNWAQCDSSQEDYIENRPFYDDTHTFKFTDGSAYDEPAYRLGDGTCFYRISDRQFDLKYLDNSDEIFIKIKNEEGLQEIKVPLIKSDEQYERYFPDGANGYFLGCFADVSGGFIGDSSDGAECPIVIAQTMGDMGTADFPCFAIIYIPLEYEFENGNKMIVQPGIYDVKFYDEETNAYYPSAKPLQIATHKYHKLDKKFLPEDYSSGSVNIEKILGGAS